jgi:hypothetical protein
MVFSMGRSLVQATVSDANDVAGVSGIAHVANTGLSPNPEPYITEVVNALINPLRTAAKSPSIKRFVYTSSSMAAAPWKADEEYTLGRNDYNEWAAKNAREPPFDATKIFTNYAASKVAAEKAAWAWVKEAKDKGELNFVFSTVLPSANHGPVLDREAQGWPSTGGWPKAFYDGQIEQVKAVPPRKCPFCPDLLRTKTDTPNRALRGRP